MLLHSLFVVFLVNFGVGVQSQGLFDPHNVVTEWTVVNNNLYLATNQFSVSFMIRGEYMLHTAIFDAVSVYTKSIMPFIATDVPKRPMNEYSDVYRSKALSFAAYSVLKNIYGANPAFSSIADPLMASLNYNTHYTGKDISRPDGVGNYVAAKVIANRSSDGFNQYGDHPGTVGGAKYSDWTQYRPVNKPQATNGRTLCSELIDINLWQPLRYLNQIQVWDGPHIGLGKPFALVSGLDYVTQGPAYFDTNTDADALAQLDEIVNISGNLGDREKIQGEWIAFNSYNNFGIFMAREKDLSIIDTAKLMFLHGGAEMDSVIAAWAIKARFGNARPISQIQCKLVNQTIRAYKGPYLGVGDMPGQDFQPYPAYDAVSPLFRTPNFPDYVSGHSTSGGAVFEAYKRFFGSDRFNFSVTIPAGQSIVEPKITDSKAPGYKKGITDIPNTGPASIGYSPARDVTLSWATFSDAAVAAALSRMYIGIHYRSASFDGITVGRYAGGKAFELYSKYITGICD